MMAQENTGDGPILHVVVVGFHHKKGCQVEYSYPPLIAGNPVDSNEVPDAWKHLPSLAIPDGAHNYEKDTIFFHLRSQTDNGSQTIYGISCYRQIDAKQLLNKDAEVTRNTVQKSVCVLSKLSLYGMIQSKLELITHAYFDERDFSQVALLQETYNNLNLSLRQSLLTGSQLFLGFTLKKFVETFKHKILLLFKLILLERRVLFFGAPVEPVCKTILSALSLFPGVIESGLVESATYSPKHTVSPTLRVARLDDGGEEFLEVSYSQDNHSISMNTSDNQDISMQTAENQGMQRDEKSEENVTSPSYKNKQDKDRQNKLQQQTSNASNSPKTQHGVMRVSRTSSVASDSHLTDDEQQLLDNDDHNVSFEGERLLLKISETSDTSPSLEQASLPDEKRDEESSDDTMDSSSIGLISSKIVQVKDRLSSTIYGWAPREDSGNVELRDLRPPSPVSIPADEYGFPLAIFTKGMLCHPYLSLQYYDLLQDANVRGFVVGASNALFKQKRHMLDAVIEVNEGRVDIHDAELRRQLNLTTADLRFADFLVKSVMENQGQGNTYLDSTAWEGGDEWLRGQFRNYLSSMLASSRLNDEKLLEDFNWSFIQAWRTTHNYKLWRTKTHSGIDEITSGHPFEGQLNMKDMKIRLTHSLQSTEKGKKINQAMMSTGNAVVQTGKVVGGAINSARSAMSSWFTSFTSDWKQQDKLSSKSQESLTNTNNLSNDSLSHDLHSHDNQSQLQSTSHEQ